MRDVASRSGLLTFEEFLDIEEHSDVRHEFVAGSLYAMTGASRRHNLIVWNIMVALTPAARHNRCQVFPSDMLTKVGDIAGYYPDVSVVCDRDDTHQRFTERPCLVVEISSPSTMDRDQREKLLVYRGIESVQTYLIVSQDERRVVRHWRDPDGAWRKEDVSGDGSLDLPCPGTSLSLDDIYLDIGFDID
jgi:Uma2 family endonuclease